MTTQSFKVVESQVQFDRQLQVGSRVEARWTSGGRYYRGTGVVVKLATKSARVRLEAALDPYPAGFVVSVPRFTNVRRTATNGIFPIEPVAQGLPPKLGRIAAIDARGEQRVVTFDDGAVYFLTPGYNAARDGKVGSYVELEYRSTRTLGLWYGRVIPASPFSRACQCGIEYIPKNIAEGVCPKCRAQRRNTDNTKR